MRKLLTILGCAALALSAQSKRAPADDADQKELYSYVLTMDKIQKLGNATKTLQEYSKKHPELNTNQSSDAKNLDDMAAKLGKYPEVVTVLKQNGLTPREYSVALMTVMQASIAVGFKKSGTYKEYPPDMLKLVSKENLAFVDQHFDEIKKLMNMGSDQ